MSDKKILAHLARIEGQVKGVQKMIVDERQCDEVLQQIMAIKSALDRVKTDLVSANMETCFKDYGPDEIKEKMAKTIGLLCKM